MATNWTTIAVDDLNEYQAGKIITAARTRALAAGQPDPFPYVMADVIGQMRSDIAENPVNAVSATAGTVPSSLRKTAILLIIEAMQGRLPGVEIQDTLETQISDAKKLMIRIANGKPIEQPNDPESPKTVVAVSPLIEAAGEDRPRQVTRETMASI